MRQILASFTCLPKLVEGKVCIVINNNYMLCYVPSTITIEDNFNPMDYCLLNEGKWRNLIVYSRKQEREQFLVNKLWKEYNSIKPYRVGDRIHIHSRRGIYELVEIAGDWLKITCKKWQYEDNPVHLIHKNDFKCLAGGLHNLVI